MSQPDNDVIDKAVRLANDALERHKDAKGNSPTSRVLGDTISRTAMAIATGQARV